MDINVRLIEETQEDAFFEIDLDEESHEILSQRAQEEGMSLEDYMRMVITQEANKMIAQEAQKQEDKT